MEKIALHGGTPVREEFLLFHKPFIEEDDIAEVADALRSGWITTGPRTKRFEEIFKNYTGAKHAIALNSCTAGLHLALVVSGIGPGDEVITSPITFASTANVIVHQGATPVLVDVEPDTLNIDVNKIEEKITSATKAIMPVHFAGYPCQMDRILEIARKYKLTVIEDAAHAIETEYGDQKVGNIGDFTAFSFYATKNLTTGEGGMLTTNHDELAEKARILSLHGISRDAWKRYSDEGYKHWDIIYPGYKYNMFDIQAALGLKQFEKIASCWKIRQDYTEFYTQFFEKIPEIMTLSPKGLVKPSYHLYVILVRTELLKADRDTLIKALQAENIGIGIHFRAIHLHPYYQKHLKLIRGSLPIAEYASDRVISLPLYPKMSQADLQDVTAAVEKIVRYYRKS
jgi:dTDP-4-amino-4,6-dideoxygalactose transaminase